MGWKKNIVLRICGLIAMVAISLFAYKHFRASKAAQTKIPENAYAVWKVNFDNLFLRLFQNSLFHYADYYKSKDRKGENRGFKVLNMGITPPSSLYFFSLSDTSTCFYTVLEITDKNKLQTFLTEQLNFTADTSFQNKSDVAVYYFRKHLSVWLDDHKAILSFGSKPSPETMIDLLKSDQQNWIFARSLGKGVKEIEKGDFTYVDRNKNWCTINFESGIVYFSGYITSDLFQFPSAPQLQETFPDDILSFQLNTDLSTLLKSRQTDLMNLHLSVDSLCKYVGDYIAVRWKNNMVMEQDTIVTFEYDDNFDMVEVVDLQETEVPNLSFQIKGAPALATYLPEKMFYKFTKSYAQELLHLTTDRESKPAVYYKPSDYVLLFNYIKTPLSVRYLNGMPKLSNISQAKLNGESLSEKELRYVGELRFSDKGLNSLYQLLK